MRTLCVMVKVPVMGLVKTRLAREIGAPAALAAYRAMVAQTLRRLGSDPRWRVVLAIAPDALVTTPAFPAKLERVPQGKGDLGARMQRLFEARRGHGPVLVIGSDSPGITPQHIARAFAALDGNDAVMGPAPDGGYWTIGFGRRKRLAPFANVRWSSAHTFADTRKNLKRVRVAVVDELDDVDTAAGWRAWTRRPASFRFRGG